jgi:DNA polymerase/3'-5' exonuclease PolX
MSELINIPGLGPVKIKNLEKSNITTLQQLKKYAAQPDNDLPQETKLYLQLSPNFKIVKSDIDIFQTEFTKLYGQEFTIVGSYRRGAETSGDIDLMIWGSVDTFNLAYQILQTHFNLHEFAHGSYKFAGYISFPLAATTPQPNNYYVHIDVFYSPPEERAAQLLYATGSKEHNIKMRALAKKRGFLLNQKGLYMISDKDGITITPPKLIPTYTEQDIYTAIGMKYVQPNLRR